MNSGRWTFVLQSTQRSGFSGGDVRDTEGQLFSAWRCTCHLSNRGLCVMREVYITFTYRFTSARVSFTDCMKGSRIYPPFEEKVQMLQLVINLKSNAPWHFDETFLVCIWIQLHRSLGRHQSYECHLHPPCSCDLSFCSAAALSLSGSPGSALVLLHRLKWLCLLFLLFSISHYILLSYQTLKQSLKVE